MKLNGANEAGVKRNTCAEARIMERSELSFLNKLCNQLDCLIYRAGVTGAKIDSELIQPGEERRRKYVTVAIIPIVFLFRLFYSCLTHFERERLLGFSFRRTVFLKLF